MKKIPKLEAEEMRLISDSGADGPVYRISDSKAAKFEWARDWTRSFTYVSFSGKVIQNEFEVCRALYEHGVSVPKPYGVFRLRQPDESAGPFRMRFPAFVMDYLDGSVPHPKYLQPEVQEKVEGLVKIERERVRDLGFVTDDAMGWENTIWVPSMEKIFLIDFSRWQLPGSNQK